MNKTSFIGDKPVSRIGFGAMQLAGRGVFRPPRDPDQARAVLRRAIELGVDHIDTAQYYGPDVVNDLIRDALYPYPENLKLVTQVALAWLLSRYDRMLLIPGTSSVRHLEENMAAADVELDEQDLDELESATELGHPMAAAHDLRSQSEANAARVASSAGP